MTQFLKDEKAYREIYKIHNMFRGAIEDLFNCRGNTRQRLSTANRNFTSMFWDKDLKSNIPPEAERDFLIVKKYMYDVPAVELEKRLIPLKLSAKKKAIPFDVYILNFPLMDISNMILCLNGKLAKKTSIAIMNVYFALEDKILELQKDKIK